MTQRRNHYDTERKPLTSGRRAFLRWAILVAEAFKGRSDAAGSIISTSNEVAVSSSINVVRSISIQLSGNITKRVPSGFQLLT